MIKFIKQIKDFIVSLKFIFMPGYWFANKPISKYVTEEIKKIISEDLVESVNYYNAVLKDGRVLWIANYPYAFATLGPFDGDAVADRTTRLAFHKYLKNKFPQYPFNGKNEYNIRTKWENSGG